MSRSLIRYDYAVENAFIYLDVNCFCLISGHYVYIETSSPVLTKPNDTALLVSPTFPGTTTGRGCLRFWYNLHGTTIGHLAVYMVDTATQTGHRLWEVDGDHGNHWYPAAMSLFYIKPFVVS